MAPKIKEDIAFDRQSSSFSALTASTVSTSSYSSDYKPLKSTRYSPLSTASIANFIISLALYTAFVYHTKSFVPSHDEAYDRPHPYQTTKSGDTILNSELNHPLVHPASVPARLLFQGAVLAPLVIMALVHVRSSWNCAFASASGLLAGIGFCEVSTHCLKYYVLRRRPNFYALCDWDEAALQCRAAPKKILEAQLSFPSGHSSISWCGMTFLVLVLLGRLQLSNPGRPWWKQWAVWLTCLVPWSWSAYVATSRIVDMWHHTSDVVAGTMLGVLCGSVSYHSLFPHVFSVDAGTSYAELTVQKNE